MHVLGIVLVIVLFLVALHWQQRGTTTTTVVVLIVSLRAVHVHDAKVKLLDMISWWV